MFGSGIFVNSKNKKSKNNQEKEAQPKISQFFSSTTTSRSTTKSTNNLFNGNQNNKPRIDPNTAFNMVKATPPSFNPKFSNKSTSQPAQRKSPYFDQDIIEIETKRPRNNSSFSERFLNEDNSSKSSSRNTLSEINSNFGGEIFDYRSSVTRDLSPEQNRVIDLIFREKKNVFFTGSAGTGKSLIIRKIIEIAKNAEYTGRANKLRYDNDTKYLAITATTGLAAFHLGGTTIHSFAGIGLGNNTAEKLAQGILAHKLKRKKWNDVQILIIDEISMMDADLFDKLEYIARAVRKSTKPFGGIQLIITGDFFQLPPVQKGMGVKFSFEAKSWESCIHETIVLNRIYRQKDPELTRILNEVRRGKVSENSLSLFQSLYRPLNMDDGLEPTQLFPTRNEVDAFNSNKLKQLTGAIHRFVAFDSGEEMFKKQLNNVCRLPEVLDLKIDSQVMLLKNLPNASNNGMVNGLLGRVIGFEKYDGSNGTEKNDSVDPTVLYPRVRFINKVVRTIVPEDITWENNGEILAKRIQVPLGLAWSMSIHKAQGLTLEKVKIDLGRIFEKGQAYVALSRCTTVEGLQVLNFNAQKVQSHPKVIQYYAKYETPN